MLMEEGGGGGGAVAFYTIENGFEPMQASIKVALKEAKISSAW